MALPDNAGSRDRGRRLVPAFLGVLAVAFLVVEVYDLDVFWNVAIGRDILARHAVPRVDRYTVAGFGHPNPDIHWLFQVVAALAHRVAGWVGVQLLAVLAWGAALAIVASSERFPSSPAPGAAGAAPRSATSRPRR